MLLTREDIMKDKAVDQFIDAILTHDQPRTAGIFNDLVRREGRSIGDALSVVTAAEAPFVQVPNHINIRDGQIVLNVSAEVRTFTQVAAGNQNWLTQVLGESADYLEIRQWPLAEGAMFTEQDVRSSAKIAVIGQTTARQLFGDNSPVGQIIRVKNSPFVIAGMLALYSLQLLFRVGRIEKREARDNFQ